MVGKRKLMSDSCPVFLVETGKKLVISKVGMNLREYNY